MQNRTNLEGITRLRRGLATHGYRVTPVKGKDACMRRWQTARWSADQMEGIARNYPDATNTGILTGEVVALDIDTPDHDVAAAINTMVADIPGYDAAPYRIGKAPKRCYIFRAAEPRRVVKTGKYLVNGCECQIEVLGIGQQFVADGVHPGTLRPYEWHNGSPAETPLADLPVVETADIDALLQRAEAYLAERGDLLKRGRFTPATANDNERTYGVGEADSDHPWSIVKQRAYANLSAWVEDLQLEGLEPYDAGYHSVASFRPTNSTTAKERKRALNIQPKGICDYGAGDKGYSPIDLVEACLGLTPQQAFDWLRERVGGGDDTPPINVSGLLAQLLRRAAAKHQLS